MRINPFVRKVNKAFTSWKDHNIPLRKMYDYELFVLLEGELNFTYNTQTITLSSGEILINGYPLVISKEKVGYMLQNDQLLPWKTIYENVIHIKPHSFISRAYAREALG